MKLHILVHIVWGIVMLFFGIVSIYQTGVFLCYLIFGLCVHVGVVSIQSIWKYEHDRL